VRFFYLFLLTTCISITCGKAKPVINLSNSNWPEGTCVTVLQKGRIKARTALFGDYVKISVPEEGFCQIRVASPSALTWISEKIPVNVGTNNYSLPSCIPRRRIGSSQIGLTVQTADPDSIYAYMLETTYPSITTISPTIPVWKKENSRGLSNPGIIALAHAKAVEVTVQMRLAGREYDEDLKSYCLSLIDSLEVFGVDGIIIVPKVHVLSSEKFIEFIKKIASEVHKRGMTFGISLQPGNKTLNFNPEALFSGVPTPETPDELRIMNPQSENSIGGLSVNVVDEIEEVLDHFARSKIPLSKVTVELALTSAAYSDMGNGTYKPVDLEEGTFTKILSEVGMDAAFRLRDESLRLGYRGVIYVFDDVDGISKKIRRLRSGNLSSAGGIHIVYDRCGVEIDSDDLKQISVSFISP